MRHDPLSLTIDATCAALEQRYQRLCAGDDGNVHAHTDAFVAAAGRHLAAVDGVLLPAVRRHARDARPAVDDYCRCARRLERDLVRLQGRAYGESHAVHLPWQQVCADVHRALHRHNDAERALVERLTSTLTLEEAGRTAERLFHAEVRGPTRPHPYLPRNGLPGVLTRRVWAVADRFWDDAQGRIVPAPVSPRRHSHDSLVAQYLCADPHFDNHASLIAHKTSGSRTGWGGTAGPPAGGPPGNGREK